MLIDCLYIYIDILSHFTAGKQFINDPQERLKLTGLLLIAGRRAKDNSAYQPAANYFLFGVELLPKDAWETHYNITIQLYKELAECEYLRGNFQKAEDLYPLIIEKAKTLPEKINVYWIKMNQFEIQQRCMFLTICSIF